MNFVRTTILVGILLLATNLFATNFDVVPKVRSLEAGYRYMANSSLSMSSLGWGAQFDVMWQVSGFEKKRPSFISIPMGFSQFPEVTGSNDPNTSILYYGWTIKHNLARDKKWIPVLSYNLLMNQVWQKGTEGRVMGHETRFDFSYEYHPDNKKLYYYLKLEYSHMTFPALGQEKSDKMDAVSLKLGMGF